jgi:hypothetical protein
MNVVPHNRYLTFLIIGVVMIIALLHPVVDGYVFQEQPIYTGACIPSETETFWIASSDIPPLLAEGSSLCLGSRSTLWVAAGLRVNVTGDVFLSEGSRLAIAGVHWTTRGSLHVESGAVLSLDNTTHLTIGQCLNIGLNETRLEITALSPTSTLDIQVDGECITGAFTDVILPDGTRAQNNSPSPTPSSPSTTTSTGVCYRANMLRVVFSGDSSLCNPPPPPGEHQGDNLGHGTTPTDNRSRPKNDSESLLLACIIGGSVGLFAMFSAIVGALVGPCRRRFFPYENREPEIEEGAVVANATRLDSPATREDVPSVTVA